MKAHFIGGIMDGYQFDIQDDTDELIFPRWHCNTYPSKGYKIEHTYRRKSVINLGCPVVFYERHEKPSEVPYCGSMAQQQNMAAATNLQQMFGSPLLGAFGRGAL